MTKQPDHTWQWHYHQQQQRLVLDIDPEMMFVTSLGRRQIVGAPRTNDDFLSRHGVEFAIHHANDFHHFMEQLEQRLGLSGDKALQISLNAVAAKFFHRPLMPKSWYFNPVDSGQAFEAGEVVCLSSTTQTRHYLVVEAGDKAALLLLIERNHELNSLTELTQFAVIRVMNDRLQTMQTPQRQRVNAA